MPRQSTYPTINEECVSEPLTSIPELAEKDDIDFDLINVVKEELKHSIHQRRKDNGLGDIQCNKGSSFSFELTATEQRKRQLKKDRNRIAAAKCRENKREKRIQLMQDLEKLIVKNRDLQQQADRLKAEKSYLQRLVRSHLAVCTKRKRGYRR